jgi:hypothetical protein
LQLAAYCHLWNELNPLQELDDLHLLILSKDGAGFKHCFWSKSELTREWEIFKAYREAYRLEKEIKPAKVTKEPKAEASTSAQPAKPAAKPRVRVKVQTEPVPTLAEMLRAYGHVPGVAA